MSQFVYFEKNPSEGKKGKKKKSFAPARRAKVEDDIEDEIEMPFLSKGGAPEPTEEEATEERQPSTKARATAAQDKPTSKKATRTVAPKEVHTLPSTPPSTKTKAKAASPSPVSSSNPVSSSPSATTTTSKTSKPTKQQKTTSTAATTTTTTSATTTSSSKPSAKKATSAGESPTTTTAPATVAATTTTQTKKTKTKTTKVPHDPAFVREKERFLARFRTVVESLAQDHAPLGDHVTGRTREVNAVVRDICSEFVVSVEATPLPTKPLSEEEYQRRQREEAEQLADTRAREVRCAKLRQRIDLLRREIQRQQGEREQWDALRQAYAQKHEELQTQLELQNKRLRDTFDGTATTPTAKRRKRASLSVKSEETDETKQLGQPDFLNGDDRALLAQLAFAPMDVERATQTIALQVDYLNGTLREMTRFDTAVEGWTRRALATYHRQWQNSTSASSASSTKASGSADAAAVAANPRDLIRGITKS